MTTIAISEEEQQLRFLSVSNSWEDTSILLEAIGSAKGKRIFSIAGAGDNLFSMCGQEPEIIVAADENPAQLYLIELKKVAIEQLEYSDCLEFLGYSECAVRLLIYKSISEFLSQEAQDYWDNHLQNIDQGVIHAGKFEHYFQLFCNRVLPFIHSEKTINELFEQKSAEEQVVFYDKVWNTRLWRLFFKLFFSRRMLARSNQTIVLPNEIEISKSLFDQAEEHFKSVKAQSNGMLHYMLTNEFGTHIPHYLREENYENVKSNCGKIKLVEGSISDVIKAHGKFDLLQFADYFEHISATDFELLSNEISVGCAKDARLVYWNLLNDRQFANVSELFTSQSQSMEQLNEKDLGFYYKTVVVEDFVG